MLDDLPPQSLTAEQQTLGTMLLANSTVDDIFAVVRPGMFYAEKHQTIAHAILRMREAGTPIDTGTLAERLHLDGRFDEIGGAAYFEELLESVPHGANGKHYAEIVLARYRQRVAVDAFSEGLRKLRHPVSCEDVTAVIAEAEHGLQIAGDEGLTNEAQRIGDSLPDAIAGLAAGRGVQETIPSGFESINNHLGGIPLGQMTVVAARPSVGKTSLMLAMCSRMAEAGIPSLFVSYEQRRPELLARVLSLFACVELSKLQRGNLKPAENERIVEASVQMQHMPLWIDDACRDESSLGAAIRLHVRRHKVRAILIDYLQLIGPADRRANREAQVAGISRSLKLLAMQTGAAVIVASQLNRQAEQRDSKRPRLSDLRESGAIEQDADLCLGLWRPNKDTEQPDDHGELCILKNRNGPQGSIRLQWDGQFARYRDGGGIQ